MQYIKYLIIFVILALGAYLIKNQILKNKEKREINNIEREKIEKLNALFERMKSKNISNKISNSDTLKTKNKLTLDEQIKIFNSINYFFNEKVTKEDIFKECYEYEDPEEEFIEEPFSRLYYFFGWRNDKFNFSNKCIWYDLEFIDSNTEYIWFMERMGAITQGDISFTNIEITIDSENIEWLNFKVNGISKKWKLEKRGIISDSFFQRFSSLPLEMKTQKKYTYFSDGGQQFVIDYSSQEENIKFKKITGLQREWLGEGNHFSDPEN